MYAPPKHSNVTFNVHSQRHEDRIGALRTGEIDLVLSAEPLVDRYVQSEIVFTETMVSLVRSKHPTVKSQLKLEQFLELRHVVQQWEGGRQAVVDQWLQKKGLKRDCRLQVHSLLDMPPVVARTNMICSLPSKMAHLVAKSYGLKCFPTPIPDLKVPAYLSWHVSFADDPGLSWLRRATLAVLEGQALEAW